MGENMNPTIIPSGMGKIWKFLGSKPDWSTGLGKENLWIQTYLGLDRVELH